MMEISHHPAARRPGLALLICFGLGLVGSAAWQFLPEPLVTLPLLAFLAYSLLPFFVPTRYRLSPSELEIGSRRYPWERFRAFVVDKNGVFLTPYRQSAPTERLRGVFLPLTRQDRLKVVKWLRERGLEERA